MKWIKGHITLLVVIIIGIALVLPICINALYIIGTDCEILHKPSEWTKFWGSYLGAIISAVVAFIILGIQHQQNKKENGDNRELQKSVLKHQIRTQRLNDMESRLITYFQSFNYAEVDNLAYQISKKEDRYPIMQRLKELWKVKDTATLQLKIVFASSLDQQELEYQRLFEDFDTQYEALIEDLLWFCDIGYHSGDDAMLNQ